MEGNGSLKNDGISARLKRIKKAYKFTWPYAIFFI